MFKGRQWNKGSLWLSRREDCHRAIKPEVLRTIEEFQRGSFVASEKMNSNHPASSAAEQKKFHLHLNNLLRVVEEGRAVNPYKKIGAELCFLSQRGQNGKSFLKYHRIKISYLSSSVLSYKYMQKIPDTSSSAQKQIKCLAISQLMCHR